MDDMTANILKDIEEIGNTDNKNSVRLDLPLLKRIVIRLSSFSESCELCKEYLEALKEHIEKLKAKQGVFDKTDFLENQRKMKSIIAHLQQAHKLVTEGYYVGIFMSIGMSIGLMFGLILYNNISMGLPLGLGFGLCIGYAVDADAKKKGLTI